MQERARACLAAPLQPAERARARLSSQACWGSAAQQQAAPGGFLLGSFRQHF